MRFAPRLADLIALETLSLHGQLSFTFDIAEIVKLHKLAKVKLSRVDEYSRKTVLQIAMLASQLAARRPDVSFMLEHQQIQ